MMNCGSDRITAISTATGQVHSVREMHRVTKVNDTIVLVATNKSYGYSFYGKYVGSLPESSTSKNGLTVFYVKAVRVK